MSCFLFIVFIACLIASHCVLYSIAHERGVHRGVYYSSDYWRGYMQHYEATHSFPDRDPITKRFVSRRAK